MPRGCERDAAAEGPPGPPDNEPGPREVEADDRSGGTTADAPDEPEGRRVEVNTIGREVSTEPSCIDLVPAVISVPRIGVVPAVMSRWATGVVPVAMSGSRRGVCDEASGLAVVGPLGDAPGADRLKVVTCGGGTDTCGEGTVTCGEGDTGVERFMKVGPDPAFELPRLKVIVEEDGLGLGSDRRVVVGVLALEGPGAMLLLPPGESRGPNDTGGEATLPALRLRDRALDEGALTEGAERMIVVRGEEEPPENEGAAERLGAEIRGDIAGADEPDDRLMDRGAEPELRLI